MNNKSIIIVIVFTALLLSIIILLNKIRQLDYTIGEVSKAKHYIYEELNGLRFRRINEIKLDGQYIDENISLFYENGETYNIKDIIKTNTLVFYYNSQACHTCLETELKRLQKIVNLKFNIVVFANFTNLDNYYKLIRIFSDLDIIYNLPSGFELINTLEPIYFVLDKDLKIENSFIPNSNEDKITDIYIESLFNYLK